MLRPLNEWSKLEIYMDSHGFESFCFQTLQLWFIYLADKQSQTHMNWGISHTFNNGMYDNNIENLTQIDHNFWKYYVYDAVI